MNLCSFCEMTCCLNRAMHLQMGQLGFEQRVRVSCDLPLCLPRVMWPSYHPGPSYIAYFTVSIIGCALNAPWALRS